MAIGLEERALTIVYAPGLGPHQRIRPGRHFLLAAPPATVSVAGRPQLKRLMRAYALASGVRIPAGFAVNCN